MRSRFILTIPLTAALALACLPAAAQHGHGSHGDHGAAPAKAKKAIAEGRLENGVRVVDVAVTDEGYEPSRIKVKRGEKVRLVVTRKTNSACLKEITVKSHGIKKDLPVDKPVNVEFTATESGEIRYACGMDHVHGVVFVP